jgi:outer membrane protein assembly factor BamA
MQSQAPSVRHLLGIALLLSGVTATARAQEETPRGLEVGGLPALDFDSDEGFGYGVVLEIYYYGEEGLLPYDWTVQPTFKLTTGGRRDITLFLDAPHLLSGGWRLDAFVGSERQITTPYYGIGNETAFDPAIDDPDGPDPYYYRYGRTRRTASFNLQRPIVSSHLRLLFGAGLVQTTLDPFPRDHGTTLFALEHGATEETLWSNYVRGGVVWDTRDRETGPRRGSWTELLVQWVDEGLGANVNYGRWTLTDRRYLPIGDRFVFAHRYLLRGFTGNPPTDELFQVQTSFKQQEGLGGGKTVRGVLKNRFVGQGMLVWNAELRWRAIEFRALNRPFHVVFSAFVDHGRVWAEEVRLGELLNDLHRGVGGGVRIGMGENFLASVDVGHSSEAGFQVYLGMGYLY